MVARLLVVDDESQVLAVIKRMLRDEPYEIVTAGSGLLALAILQQDTPDILLSDLSMPGMTGLELLARLREEGRDLPTVLMSGAGTIADAVEAVKLGAHDFIEKPIKAERLIVTLAACAKYVRLHTARELLRDGDALEGLVGNSPAMQRLKALIVKVAPTEGRVLITGENGTGKEIVAAAIHAGSPRAREPYVKLNCSAVPRELIESELFGHEKGAFTGATSGRKGRFELADHGTLFLDEVGDTPPAMQVKLLRVLQEGQFERVGGQRTLRVDVRVIAATNRNLEEMVARGEFREDLYYRLNVVALHTPPLRDRAEDIPLLARHFASLAAARNRRPLELTEDAVRALMRHRYPGNVRELSNIVERLAILAAGERIDAADVELALPTAARSPVGGGKMYRPGCRLADLVAEAERTIIEEAIEANDGNKSAAARALDLERSHFYKKCKQLGVELGTD